MATFSGDAAPTPTVVGLAPPVVLIIDDEIAIQRVVARVLEKAGFRVRTASNVDGALQVVSGEAVGLALCDMRMPGCSGFDFTVEALKIDPALPVVIMSGAIDDQTRAKLVAAGIRLVVEKPIQAESLVAIVKTHARSLS